jgi:hypothetical protein
MAELNEDDILSSYIQENTGIKKPEIKIVASDERIGDMKYITFPVTDAPCGIFYPQGSTFQIRPAEVAEIQAYSMVDETNIFDVYDKFMNLIIACVKIKYPDGSIGSGMDIKYKDVLYLILLLREITFQKGATIDLPASCSCGTNTEIKIPLLRKNVIKAEFNDKLMKYYDGATGSLIVTSKEGIKYSLGAFTIGLFKTFREYATKKATRKEKIGDVFSAFMSFTGALCHTKISLTEEAIDAKFKEFSIMDKKAYQAIYSIAKELEKIGIEEVKMNCSECGLEVRTDIRFPFGYTSIFVDESAADDYFI